MPPKGSKKSSSAAALPAEPIIRRRRVKGPQAADEDPESTRLAEMDELKDLMQLKNGTFVNAEVLDAFSEGLSLSCCAFVSHGLAVGHESGHGCF